MISRPLPDDDISGAWVVVLSGCLLGAVIFWVLNV
jgi:hypothetical protein